MVGWCTEIKVDDDGHGVLAPAYSTHSIDQVSGSEDPTIRTSMDVTPDSLSLNPHVTVIMAT